MERKVRDSCGESESRGDPAGARAPRTDPPEESECPTFQSTFELYSL
ncbi:hypothetical protein ACIP97_10885 [Peribacillus frigoritolerans]